MRLIRGLGAALLWLGAALTGLVGVVLCVTLILIPLGLPVIGLARRMFQKSMKLMAPRAVAHPVRESRRQAAKLKK